MEAKSGERRATLDALVFARRLLLVLIAGILVVVGAMTADHIETVGTPGSDISPTATVVQDTSVVTTGLSMLTAGTAIESNEWSTADLVLLTCSIVALLVLLVHIFRVGPTLGAPQRSIDEHAIHLLPSHVRLNVDGPDRLALCVIRT